MIPEGEEFCWQHQNCEKVFGSKSARKSPARKSPARKSPARKSPTRKTTKTAKTVKTAKTAKTAKKTVKTAKSPPKSNIIRNKDTDYGTWEYHPNKKEFIYHTEYLFFPALGDEEEKEDFEEAGGNWAEYEENRTLTAEDKMGLGEDLREKFNAYGNEGESKEYGFKGYTLDNVQFGPTKTVKFGPDTHKGGDLDLHFELEGDPEKFAKFINSVLESIMRDEGLGFELIKNDSRGNRMKYEISVLDRKV
jgi:hypothetical protein